MKLTATFEDTEEMEYHMIKGPIAIRILEDFNNYLRSCVKHGESTGSFDEVYARLHEEMNEAGYDIYD